MTCCMDKSFYNFVMIFFIRLVFFSCVSRQFHSPRFPPCCLWQTMCRHELFPDQVSVRRTRVCGRNDGTKEKAVRVVELVGQLSDGFHQRHHAVHHVPADRHQRRAANFVNKRLAPPASWPIRRLTRSQSMRWQCRGTHMLWWSPGSWRNFSGAKKRVNVRNSQQLQPG